MSCCVGDLAGLWDGDHVGDSLGIRDGDLEGAGLYNYR